MCVCVCVCVSVCVCVYMCMCVCACVCVIGYGYMQLLAPISFPQCLASFFSCPPSSSASSPSPWLSLRRLSLSHNPLGPTCGPALGRLLSSCRGLRELGLKCCGLTAAVFDRHTGVSQALKGVSAVLPQIGAVIERPRRSCQGLNNICPEAIFSS